MRFSALLISARAYFHENAILHIFLSASHFCRAWRSPSALPRREVVESLQKSSQGPSIGRLMSKSDFWQRVAENLIVHLKTGMLCYSETVQFFCIIWHFSQSRHLPKTHREGHVLSHSLMDGACDIAGFSLHRTFFISALSGWLVQKLASLKS